MEAQDAAPTLEEPAAAAASPTPAASSPTETKPLMAEDGGGSNAGSPTPEDRSDAHKKMQAFEEQKRKAESVDMVRHSQPVAHNECAAFPHWFCMVQEGASMN